MYTTAGNKLSFLCIVSECPLVALDYIQISEGCAVCGQVGDTFLAYENEILYHRRLLADETALISRDSKFK